MIISSSSQQTAVKVYNDAIGHYKFKAIRSMDDAMDNKCPALAEINTKLTKKGAPDQLTNILKIMVLTTAKEYNITRTLDRAQVDSTVEAIQEEFNYLKLSEVFFIFKQAGLGRIEKTFERMDKPTIIGWFDDYAAKRMVKAEERSMQKYDNFIEKLQIKQSNEQQKEIKDIAYKMASKMIVKNHFKPPVQESNKTDSQSQK